MTIQSTNINAQVSAQTKAAPKRQTAEEAIDNVRLTGQGEVDRGSELKDQAAQLKAASDAAKQAATDNLDAANATIQAGVGTTLSGLKDLKDGQSGLSANIAAENAATQAGSDSLGSIQQGISEAHDLNTKLGFGAVVLGAGLAGEAIVAEDLKKNVTGYAGKQAEAGAISAQMGTDNGALIAGLDAEKAAAGKVNENVAAFEASLASYNESSATLREGLAEQVHGFNLNRQSEDDKLSAGVRREWAATYTGESNEYADRAVNMGKQGSQQMGKAVSFQVEAAQFASAAADLASVSSLLAEVAAIDEEAGGKLQAIPSFVAEGNATLDGSVAKAAESSDKAAEGQGFQAISDQDAQISATAFGNAKNFINKADAALKTSKKYGDNAQAATDEAAKLDDSAATLAAQAKEANDSGAVKKAAGESGRQAAQASRDTAEAGIQAGFAGEAEAATAQTASLEALKGGANSLEGNIVERGAILVGIGKDVHGISNAHDAETQAVTGAQATTEELQANLGAREENAATLGQSIADRETALNGQSASLDQISQGGQKVHDGAGQVRQGNYGKVVAEAQLNSATDKGVKADEQDQAADVIIDKGNKYLSAADAAAQKLRKPQA